jgi:hypothetical protein
MELHEFRQGCAVFTTDGHSPAMSVVHTEEASRLCWVKWQDGENGPMRHTVMSLERLTHVPSAPPAALALVAEEPKGKEDPAPLPAQVPATPVAEDEAPAQVPDEASDELGDK